MIVTSFGGINLLDYDGTGYECWISDGSGHALPGVQAYLVERQGYWPMVSGLSRPGKRFTLFVYLLGADIADLEAGLLELFDPDDETPKRLVVTDDDGSRERYVMCLCESLQPAKDGRGFSERLFVATMVVDGDVRWRAVTEDSETWNITASGDTKVVANGGDADAFPVLTIEPTSIKTGAYAYRRWVPVRNRINTALWSYPYELTDGGLDTAALVTAGKAQADGDDFRIMVDGSEVARWFGTGSYAFNQATTKVWVGLNLAAAKEFTLKTAIASTGDVDTIEVNEDISGMPSAGTVLIDNEAFTYTSKNNTARTFNNVTRAAKTTSMAGHTAGTDVFWIEHDIWILYGNAAATAPVINDNYKPIFRLDSSNTSWDYEAFGENDGLRRGAWSNSIYDSFFGRAYTSNHSTDADPWIEIGCRLTANPLSYASENYVLWYLYHPCRITNMNFQNGEKYSLDVSHWQTDTGIVSSPDGSTWSLEYAIAAPAADDTWEAWSQNEAIAGGGRAYAGMKLWSRFSVGVQAMLTLECSDVTVTLDSTRTPTTEFIGSENGAYELACTIENQSTGDSVILECVMALNQELELDTEAKTVTLLDDGSNQFQALTLNGGARRDWLPLQPGNNTLEFTDVGTGNVTITIDWRKRWR